MKSRSVADLLDNETMHHQWAVNGEVMPEEKLPYGYPLGDNTGGSKQSKKMPSTL